MAVVESKDPRLAVYNTLRVVGQGSYGEVFLVRKRGEKKQVRAAARVDGLRILLLSLSFTVRDEEHQTGNEQREGAAGCRAGGGRSLKTSTETDHLRAFI